MNPPSCAILAPSSSTANSATSDHAKRFISKSRARVVLARMIVASSSGKHSGRVAIASAVSTDPPRADRRASRRVPPASFPPAGVRFGLFIGVAVPLARRRRGFANTSRNCRDKPPNPSTRHARGRLQHVPHQLGRHEDDLARKSPTSAGPTWWKNPRRRCPPRWRRGERARGASHVANRGVSRRRSPPQTRHESRGVWLREFLIGQVRSSVSGALDGRRRGRRRRSGTTPRAKARTASHARTRTEENPRRRRRRRRGRVRRR